MSQTQIPKKEGKDVLGTITLVSVEEVVPNPWNPNAMDSETDQSLVDDMRKGGITAINPIEVALLKSLKKDYDPKKDAVFVVLDGEQRLRVARRLKWTQIRAFVREDVKDEATARSITFVRDNERGDINAFKEAENYQWHRDQGETLEDIAARYNVDKTHVSHRLSLLKIDPEVKKQLDRNTRVTVSQIEPLASLPAAAQKKLAEDIVSLDFSTREVEEKAGRVRQRMAQQKEFDDKVARSKFPNCPTCKAVANVEAWQFPDVGHVTDSTKIGNYATEEHRWNANTGKTFKQQQDEERAKAVKDAAEHKKNRPPPIPTSFKTSHTVEEFVAAGLAHFKEIVSKLDELATINGYSDAGLQGKIGKDDVTFSYDVDTEGQLAFECQVGKEILAFDVTVGSWKSEELKEMRATVEMNEGVHDIKGEKDLDKLQKEVIDWFEKYAPRPKGKPGPAAGASKK